MAPSASTSWSWSPRGVTPNNALGRLGLVKLLAERSASDGPRRSANSLGAFAVLDVSVHAAIHYVQLVMDWSLGKVDASSEARSDGISDMLRAGNLAEYRIGEVRSPPVDDVGSLEPVAICATVVRRLARLRLGSEQLNELLQG